MRRACPRYMPPAGWEARETVRVANESLAAERGPVSWTPTPTMNTLAYVTVGAGYLLAVLTASPLRLPGFLAVTVCNLGWVWLFGRLCAFGEDEGHGRVLLGMAALSLAAPASVPLGVGFDWLLPVLTTSLIALEYAPRRALVFGGALYLGTSLFSLLLDRSRATQALLQDQLGLLPVFFFTYVFTVVMRQQQEQRARAEALVAQVEETHAQLRAYADQVEELTTTRERNRMAREIHDTLGHYLTVLAVKLETAIKLEERDDPRLRAELAEARRVALECLAEVRHSVAALRPADLTAASFADALAHLVAEFQASKLDAEIALDIEGPVQSLAPELRLALYRCAQEALTNVRKHAAATKVLVRLRVEECAAELTVLDNGRGADSRADGHAPGFGLLGMGERIALLGGTAQARPDPARGWRVEVRVPLSRAPSVQPSAADLPSGEEARGLLPAGG